MDDLETDLTLAMLDRSETKLSDRPLIVSGSLLFSETKHHIIMTVRRQEKLTVNDVLLHVPVLYGLLAAHHGSVRGLRGGAAGHELTLLPVAEALPRPPGRPGHLLPHLPGVAVLCLLVLPGGVAGAPVAVLVAVALSGLDAVLQVVQHVVQLAVPGAVAETVAHLLTATDSVREEERETSDFTIISDIRYQSVLR